MNGSGTGGGGGVHGFVGAKYNGGAFRAEMAETVETRGITAAVAARADTAWF
jgi:hypothetical protein